MIAFLKVLCDLQAVSLALKMKALVLIFLHCCVESVKLILYLSNGPLVEGVILWIWTSYFLNLFLPKHVPEIVRLIHDSWHIYIWSCVILLIRKTFYISCLKKFFPLPLQLNWHISERAIFYGTLTEFYFFLIYQGLWHSWTLQATCEVCLEHGFMCTV